MKFDEHLNISLRLPDYCSVFQAQVMAIYRTAQWILAYGVPSTRISIFSHSQAAIKSQSNVLNNSKMARKCLRCFNLLSGRFSVTLIGVRGHCGIQGNYRADELATAGELLPESSSINLGVPLTPFKLAIEQKFSRNANLSWINEESFTAASLTWPSMDRRHINHFDLVIISSWSQWSLCLQTTVLWVDTRKESVPHLTTSAVDADPLIKSRLLCTFFSNVHLMRGADIGYV